MSTRAPDETPDPVTAADLLEDLRAVVRDAEALLRATEGQAGEKVDEIRARIAETLDGARERLKEKGADVEQRARAAARTADTYVHENPWLMIGIAAGIGFLVGFTSRRR
jgi:ElaB/YqjD/DUF883 family membrane-anchored ribosome-binding protein